MAVAASDQFCTYRADAIASAAVRASWDTGSSSADPITLTVTTSADAGSRRRTRLPQNCPTARHESGGSRSRCAVIR